MVSSANKCLEGVPGFGYVIARQSALAKCAGNSRSLSFDLVEQAAGLDKSGQFRCGFNMWLNCLWQYHARTFALYG
jgi:2-aminoethylphosphonate-pyruvate transaminase